MEYLNFEVHGFGDSEEDITFFSAEKSTEHSFKEIFGNEENSVSSPRKKIFQ